MFIKRKAFEDSVKRTGSEVWLPEFESLYEKFLTVRPLDTSQEKEKKRVLK